MKQQLSFLLFFNLFFLQLYSQTTTLKSSYQTYTELPREVVYLHLNKTTLVKGEDLGFTAYVLDKSRKQPSQATKNLYCVITNKNDSIVKQQLLKVDNGITNGIVKIDSLFTSGHYTVKAYTNYMRNFKERNYFTQQIRVIDPDKEKEITSVNVSKELDVQLLPEGGHLVADVPNVMGVIVKDSLGFGMGYVSGELKNSADKTLTEFRVNHLGIGRFLMIPKANESYYVAINKQDGVLKIPIQIAKEKGINLQLANKEDQVGLTFNTNRTTYKDIKNQSYALVIHNGHDMETIPIRFSKGREVVKLIDKDKLFSGINILTLFSQDNQPILERLYFNHEGIDIKQSATNAQVIKVRDTARVTLSYKNINPSKFNNFSVSVLPVETKGYGAHHNIISQTHLQPYIKSYIEDAQYYFTNITKKKQYDLDNLLLTQGWSAYAWDDIFNNPPKQEHSFDTGISFKVIAEKPKNQQLWIHPINESAPEFLNFSKVDKGYIVTEKYPLKGDSIKISKVQKGGHLIAPKVRLESYPNEVSRLEGDFLTLNPKGFNKKKNIPLKVKDFDKSLLSTTQKLDEVVVKSTKEEERRTKIRGMVQGKVDFFNEDRNNFPMFQSYIEARGFRVQGSFIVNPLTGEFPAVFLNGERVRPNVPQLPELMMLPLNRFDYVETNRTIRGFPYWTDTKTVQGFVKIYLRDPMSITIKDVRKRSTKFMPSLTFEPKKNFYKPKYQSYHDAFFKEYGVIDWLHENSVNENGELQITFPSLEQEEVKLFIEGVTEDGAFISETKTLTLTNNK